MKKKLMLSVLSGVLTVGVLAACGDAEQDPVEDDMGDDTGIEEDADLEDDGMDDDDLGDDEFEEDDEFGDDEDDEFDIDDEEEDM
ncbi:DNA primase [Alteribacter populi]|uniref:DNA primase n=1 Tax=Alteribacter populi TaxID=2011011 RepID=UPI0012FD9601|nr:DNA primase [Alteribacter populi]